MCIRMWIFLGALLAALAAGEQAFAWGSRGHELAAELGARLAGSAVLSNCHVTVDQLTEHSTDPDLKWRRDKRRHPDEAWAHFFHVDKQPADWRKRDEAADSSQGCLVYRIAKWMEKAKAQRAAGEWVELSETLFGLSHYLADLTMPLHLTSKHDGEEVGLPDLHRQWESRMLNRYVKDLRPVVEGRLKKEKIPAAWAALPFRDLVFNVAEQSYGKVQRLYDLARPALKGSVRRAEKQMPRFSKPELFDRTETLAADQLALAARLWAHALTQICR